MLTRNVNTRLSYIVPRGIPVIVIHSCPECGAPAEETDRFVLDSTDGPVAHVALRCARKHYFRMPVEMLRAFARTADQCPDAVGTVMRSVPHAKPTGAAESRRPARQYNG